jgi:hypothetical protein
LTIHRFDVSANLPDISQTQCFGRGLRKGEKSMYFSELHTCQFGLSTALGNVIRPAAGGLRNAGYNQLKLIAEKEVRTNET